MTHEAMQEAAQRLVKPHELLPLLESAMRVVMEHGEKYIPDMYEACVLRIFDVSHDNFQVPALHRLFYHCFDHCMWCWYATVNTCYRALLDDATSSQIHQLMLSCSVCASASYTLCDVVTC